MPAIRSIVSKVQEFVDKLKGIYLEDGTLVGHLLPAIDGGLGQTQKMNVAEAFQRCEYEYDDVGLAYYIGLYLSCILGHDAVLYIFNDCAKSEFYGETIMEKRPNFSEIKSYDEFAKYYWYREELSSICKGIGIDHTGTKQELNHNIEEYFKENLIKKKGRHSSGASAAAIDLESSLIDCGFSFNAKFREYFSQQTGVPNFKFTADMATAWRKVKQEHDRAFTIRDMLDIYYGRSDYAKYDNSSCEWNQFLKDFCADESNKQFRNKLKAASILWNIVRDSTRPKIYSRELVEKHLSLLQEYCQ